MRKEDLSSSRAELWLLKIPMFEPEIYINSFVLPFEQYEFLKMPFSLYNSPRIFHQAMNKRFENVDFVRVY